jgi:ubiquinol-cytochrome c reductase iron-sulfur subunit
MPESFPDPSLPTDQRRRVWIISTGTVGAVAAVATAIPFVETFEPSERARAAGGPVEVDISAISPGALTVVAWRGKPVWLYNRTPEILTHLEGHDDQLADPGSLRDQQPVNCRNATRSVKPAMFVAVGICTHLGCSPGLAPFGSANPSLPANWPGGFFCACHGSTYDAAGRVFKNKPAPLNLEIPPHHYLSDTRIMIGDDASR